MRTRNFEHTFRRQYHYATSVNTSVLQLTLTRTIRNSLCSLLSLVTWRLVSDIRRWPRRATRPGHDVVGPGLHLEVLVLAAAACQ